MMTWRATYSCRVAIMEGDYAARQGRAHGGRPMYVSTERERGPILPSPDLRPCLVIEQIFSHIFREENLICMEY